MLVTVWSLWSMWSMGPGGFVWSMWLMILATIWSIDYTSVFAFGLKLSILKIFLHDSVFRCCACSVNSVEKINWGLTLLQQRVKVFTFDFQISTTIENNQRVSSDAITTNNKTKDKEVWSDLINLYLQTTWNIYIWIPIWRSKSWGWSSDDPMIIIAILKIKILIRSPPWSGSLLILNIILFTIIVLLVEQFSRFIGNKGFLWSLEPLNLNESFEWNRYWK